MQKQWAIKILLLIASLFIICQSVFAAEVQFENNVYQDKAKIVSQQIDILKNRLTQAKDELARLEQREDSQSKRLTATPVTKELLDQANLEHSLVKSNLDSINIELTESQQTTNRLEKDIQEIDNQLNIYNIFGLKITTEDVLNLDNLRLELNYQKKILQLEKVREEYLEKLQSTVTNILQYYKTNYLRIETLLKSQTLLQLKEQQAKSEIGYQRQQSYWLQQINDLYARLNILEQNNQTDKSQFNKIQNEIFYANENISFTYLHMLIARYMDQLHSLKVSISRSSSITLLNKVSEQTQLLGKQLNRVDELVKKRKEILEKRKLQLIQNNHQDFLIGIDKLEKQYKNSINDVNLLNQQLINFRTTLDQVLQQELSSRQGLPGFSTKAWLDLGTELLIVPSLTFQVIKNLSHKIITALQTINWVGWILFLFLETAWVSLFYFIRNFLMRIVSGIPDHEYGHINLKWLSIKLIHRNLMDIAVIGNILLLFLFCRIPWQNFNFLLNLTLVWLFYKTLFIVARLCLMETVHDRNGHDVRLFYRLKWAFIVGGIVTAVTAFMHQLPLIYEVKDLFDRLFLLFLVTVSIFLLRSWEVVPGLILPHIDQRHTNVKRVVRVLGLLIPIIIFINSTIGLLGFKNFIITLSWYQGIFLFILVGYLVFRGLLNDLMDFLSQILIRHVSNGWLWTEAFLKPFSKILQVLLFLFTALVLFNFYGWDKQSPVVKNLNNLLNYQLVHMLNTSITLFNIIELGVIISVLFWAARWTREFVYRFLLSRTKDLGVRNSIAILSQYTLIVIGISICLRVLGVDLQVLAAVAAMFAFGIGLGLRDLANNFVCGFLLLFERPVRIGDTVTINNFEGEVIHIGGRAVTIRTWDHMDVLVPNAEIFSKSFVNWTAKDHIVRTVISIKINRHDRPQDVQAVIYQVLAAHKNVLKDPPAEVYLKELTDGLIEFEVRYYINLVQVQSRVAVRSEVLIAIWEVFERHGIQPPYPHHEIYIKDEKTKQLLGTTTVSG